jgi:Gly-Xaa carboxypeptidase
MVPSHATMTFERVNVHALLFTWSGSDPSLKPMVSRARGHPPRITELIQYTHRCSWHTKTVSSPWHLVSPSLIQAVVPVDPSTVHLWTHPPYSAQLDDEGWIWGRGTTDMKGTVGGNSRASLSLQAGFHPIGHGEALGRGIPAPSVRGRDTIRP